MSAEMSAKRFRIAFSFAGEKRDFVAQVAAILAKRFGEAAILYDKYHEAEFSRGDLGLLSAGPLRKRGRSRRRGLLPGLR